MDLHDYWLNIQFEIVVKLIFQLYLLQNKEKIYSLSDPLMNSNSE